MTCGRREREIALLVAGELDRPAAEALRAHLATCPACASLERALRRNAAALRELGGASVPAAVRAELHARLARPLSSARGGSAPAGFKVRRRTPLRAALAACALAAAALGAAWVLTRSPRLPGKGTAEVAAPAPDRLRPAPGAAPEREAQASLVPAGAHAGGAALAPRRSKSAPRPGEQEPTFVRLQTDDPGVVIYWQLKDSGG